MPLDYNKPEIIKYLVETYDKEKKLRQKWLETHKNLVSAVFPGKEKGYDEADAIRKVASFELSITKKDFVNAARYRKKEVPHDTPHVLAVTDIKHDNTIQSVGLGDPKEDPRLVRPDTDLSLDPIMRPVDEKQRAILYENSPENARKAYLKSRKQIDPENKYYFAETSGMEYGWRLNERKYTNEQSFGRTLQFARQNRSGPHPDPPYYGDPSALEERVKCFNK